MPIRLVTEEAKSEDEVRTEADSALQSGQGAGEEETHEDAVARIMRMGFTREEAERTMRAGVYQFSLASGPSAAVTLPHL